MASFSRLHVLQKMLDIGLVPVFYNKNIDTAKKIVTACFSGGASVVEFTNRGDLAYQVFSDLIKWAKKEFPDLILGVGSVIDPATCGLYISSGANFVVGPVLNPEIARIANRRKVAYIPGCGTASEISYAEELGSEIVKIFPGAQVGGPAFVKALLSPCPWTLIMPTGGVSPTEDNLKAWFEAGIACAGIGSKLIQKDLVKAENYNAIKNKIAETIGLIKRIKSGYTADKG